MMMQCAKGWARLAAMVLIGCFLQACATPLKGNVLEPMPAERRIETHSFDVSKGEQIIGLIAVVRTRDGDTLPDIARHFGLGHDALNAANPGVDVWVPRPDSRVVLPLMFILPQANPQGVVINLASMRLFHFDGKSRSIRTYPVGIGEEGRTTPMGEMRVERKAVRPTWYVPASIRRDHAQKGDPLPAEVPPGPENPLGEYALYLSRPTYVIHGTNKPYSIGLRATNGCLRLYPEDMGTLYQAVPAKTPVHIVNQPYLVGRAGGMLYLEAHAPQEELNAADVKKKLYARLQDIEKKEVRRLDWKRVEETLTQAQGIPVPILEGSSGIEDLIASAVEVQRPVELTGQPHAPAFKAGAWYVRVDETTGKDTAKRLAAVLNHQGPQIPALVVQTGSRYQVLAGPYANQKTAKEVSRRMKSNMELDGVIVSPDESKKLARKTTKNRQEVETPRP